MRWHLLAVGQRLPDWAEAAYQDYAKRFPPEARVQLRTVKAEPRSGGKSAAAIMAAEAQRLQAAAPKGARWVVLDERGQRCTTVELAERLQQWQRDGIDVAFVIGGADGLDPSLRAAAFATLRLSDLTLPHALARVLLIEQLYRAWSILQGHPYHRD
ncbi:23S rRNA (pseudouridine(1915)-N(3))-methyltransferase RlmH [Tepidimonas charontis]|uniref:Ribosomal RNA large subunit methyltransferase H n=1 Tax=Tepidimonas charontis TaxID=2267262 RepID=A0A554XHR8_9BURK|nr:23S rRNA (pseudouridine(1915)-N(3))-methyltransferase RlmH [Tepidimonas charontis]TSE35372.1 Ribosomal RNA large subunit methyltransferase H [Tepidimonas charontis]